MDNYYYYSCLGTIYFCIKVNLDVWFEIVGLWNQQNLIM